MEKLTKVITHRDIHYLWTQKGDDTCISQELTVQVQQIVLNSVKALTIGKIKLATSQDPILAVTAKWITKGNRPYNDEVPSVFYK